MAYAKRSVRWLGVTPSPSATAGKKFSRPQVLAEPTRKAAPADYESMTKADLVDLASRAGVDTGGTKAEIAERLRG